MKKKRLNSKDLIFETIGENPKFFTIGLEAEEVYKYEDNKRTDQLVAVRLPIIIFGISYDTVKLPKDALKNFNNQDFVFKQVDFTGLKAVEFNGVVYFSADSVSVQKENKNV